MYGLIMEIPSLEERASTEGCQPETQILVLQPGFQSRENTEIAGCRLHSCGRKSRVSKSQIQGAWCKEEREGDPEQTPEGPQ